MKVRFQDFDPEQFSFDDDPVLVLEEFWSAEEMSRLRTAMEAIDWTELKDIPDAREEFQGCGNWLKGDIAAPELQHVTNRVLLPCVKSHVESFSNVGDCKMSFSYYSYGAGDCLSMHNDFHFARREDLDRESTRRRIALATYLHEQWHVNWGGELMLYEIRGDESEARHAEMFSCLPPLPGSLVLFTVPRFHRVGRVDPFIGPNRRLSISGWFITEHKRPKTDSGIVLRTRNV